MDTVVSQVVFNRVPLELKQEQFRSLDHLFSIDKSTFFALTGTRSHSEAPYTVFYARQFLNIYGKRKFLEYTHKFKFSEQ